MLYYLHLRKRAFLMVAADNKLGNSEMLAASWSSQAGAICLSRHGVSATLNKDCMFQDHFLPRGANSPFGSRVKLVI